MTLRWPALNIHPSGPCVHSFFSGTSGVGVSPLGLGTEVERQVHQRAAAGLARCPLQAAHSALPLRAFTTRAQLIPHYMIFLSLIYVSRASHVGGGPAAAALIGAGAGGGPRGRLLHALATWCALAWPAAVCPRILLYSILPFVTVCGTPNEHFCDSNQHSTTVTPLPTRFAYPGCTRPSRGLRTCVLRSVPYPLPSFPLSHLFLPSLS